MKEVKLYKRASNGTPQEWIIRMSDKGDTGIGILYGKVNGTTHSQAIDVTMKDCLTEFNSRVAAKMKEGYKTLESLYDNSPGEVEAGALYSYLDKYLPKYNVSDNGNILPMLAKTLEDGKPFEKYGFMMGQWKINGLRCEIGAEKADDMFNPIHITFQSREGTIWYLPYLEEKLLYNGLSSDIVDQMIEEGMKLDGEIYYPGLTVNEINHLVKNPNDPRHKHLQFWIYDMAVESCPYSERRMLLEENFNNYIPKFKSKNDHLNNKETIVFLPECAIYDYTSAVVMRDNFIDLGFEGLILRNPNKEYGFGKRAVGLMYKFKKIEDGLFTIADVVPEGKKRTDLCKLVLFNDINESLFECTINTSHSDQRYILDHRDEYIGKTAKVEYRERSGVTQVPFHAKCVEIKC